VQYPGGITESEPSSTKADLEALRALQADILELERIEKLLDRFNVFETIGFITKETAHSRFLAFTPDPWVCAARPRSFQPTSSGRSSRTYLAARIPLPGA
jgi:hypothetical protein